VEQRQQPAVSSLMFEERIGLLVDREAVERESRRLVTRKKARRASVASFHRHLGRRLVPRENT
jgi:hypothetical protein